MICVVCGKEHDSGGAHVCDECFLKAWDNRDGDNPNAETAIDMEAQDGDD